MKIKTTLYVLMSKYNEKPYLCTADLSNGEYGDDTLLDTTEVEVDFEMPSNIEIRDMKIAGINKQINGVKADTEITLERLLGEIQMLMAIES